MTPTRRLLGIAAALMFAGSASIALAASDDTAPKKRHHQPTLEATIMRNAVLESLSQKTGQSVTALSELMDTNDPRSAPIFDSLNLSRQDMRDVHEQARKNVIAKAQQAGLITTDQAAELEADWVPRMGPRPGGRQDGQDRPARPRDQ